MQKEEGRGFTLPRTCLPVGSGAEWATQKAAAEEAADAAAAAEEASTWRLLVKYKGKEVSVPALPSDTCTVLAEFVADAFEGVDPAYAKLLFKGKKLDAARELREQPGLGDGGRLLLVASTAAGVERVRSSKSDPTIRGFESADALRRSRERCLRDPAAGSAWKQEQHVRTHEKELELEQLLYHRRSHLRWSIDDRAVFCLDSYLVRCALLTLMSYTTSRL